MFLLLIPESQKRPITESLLYKQIIRFFEEERILDKFEIAFITINHGVISDLNHKSKIINRKLGSLPTKRFRSGRTWLKKEQIEKMADSIVRYLQSKILNLKSEIKVIAYCRGSYLEAVHLANKKLRVTGYGLRVTPVLDEDDFKPFKKKGIRWMKIGLKMDEVFEIFQKRIKEIIKNEEENKQLKFNF